MTGRRLLAALGLGAALLIGACGVQADGEPQAIPRSDLPPDLLELHPGSSTTLPESADTETVTVYLLEESPDGLQLIPVEREVSDGSTPNERLATLFLGAQEAEVNAGISSAIPTDTVLLDVATDQDSGEVVVNVSGDLFTIEGEALSQAFAQIVWTATEPDAGGYRSVRFEVDGQPITVFDGEGAEKETVDRGDYTNLSPR